VTQAHAAAELSKQQEAVWKATWHEMPQPEIMFITHYIRTHWSTPQGYREVLRIGLPLFAGMASSMVMQFTDRLFLSHYSIDAIAAATPAALAAMTLHMSMFGLCGYTGVLAAQYVGARAPGKVGPAVWQGIWCALACTAVLLLACMLAEPIFNLIGHEPVIRKLEIQFFQLLTAGSSFGLLAAAVSGFFYGRGQTKPVMLVNIAAAVLNVPLNYALVFGAWGAPELGIAGSGIATGISWMLTAASMALLMFRKKYDCEFHVRRGWRPDWKIFKLLVIYGLPSGINMFVEFAGMSWFIFQIGNLDKIALAASNIAFSVNSLTFVPMVGLNMATATMVGQAMGRRSPRQAEKITRHALHLAFFYMVAVSCLIVVFAGPLMEIFRTTSEHAQDFEPVKQTGMILFYYVAVYSLVDSVNLIYIGALKGAGDTVAVMAIIILGVSCTLFIPMLILKLTGNVSLHALWLLFSCYVFFLALCAFLRFRGRKWHKIHMVEA
jgi:MATE family multidrug resistance protein